MISKQITTFQCMAIVVNSTIGISILALPRVASEKVGAGAFFVTCIGMVIAVSSFLLVALVSKKLSSQTVIKFGQSLLSKLIGKCFGLFLIVYFFIVTSLVIREFGEVLNTSLLNETPIIATVLSMILLVAVATRNDMTTIAYMHTYYLPFIVMPILLMVILAIQDIDPRHMKPFLGNNTTFMDFLHGGLRISGLPFIHIGLFIIPIIAPYMLDTKKVFKGSLWGAGIATFMILLATGATVAVFGSEEIRYSLWPMLVLTRMTELPMAMLDRLDVVFLIVWIISAFTTILSGYLISITLASEWLGLRSHRVLSYITVPVFLGLSLFPDHIIHVYELIEIIGKWGLLLIVGYSLFLFLFSSIRERRGNLS